MKLKKIQEGKIKFFTPEGRIYDTSVFYNPEGEMNRDLSISAIQIFQKYFKRKIIICDALAGTGIRGFRYAKEIKGVKKVVLNDKNPLAVNLIKKNAKENKLSKKCIANWEDANLLMRKNVFDIIDLDPFGSPNIFIDSAARSIYHKGFLCVTSTDQAALTGTYPETTLRKYGIKSIRTEFYNELGIRILISFIMLNLARYDRAFIPQLSISTRHYYKVFGKIEHAGKITELLKEFGYVNYCSKCGDRKIGDIEKCDNQGHSFENCGPIYLGRINDRKFCKDVLLDIRSRNFRLLNEEVKLLKLIIEEAEMPPFYYDLHYLARKTKIEIPKFEILIKRLKKNGLKASRTHFCLTSVKTDTDYKNIIKFLS
ncbi:tRNA (guanine(10)-N(2))-dimethyltransferase [Candidatus Micrarchaeota archaeon RBG_16_36_9]|nr:MAG: tRNA (guanine(10)-N(2))-dimethyltransferase [Candidatus Micrarchaeota archaeon RBG_16_36_9]